MRAAEEQVRLRLDISYDGTYLHGWAKQKGLRTVQGELEAALSTILRQTTQLTVAGRTDAGVHALGQVAHLTLRVEQESYRFLMEEQEQMDLHFSLTFLSLDVLQVLKQTGELKMKKETVLNKEI